MPDAAFPALHIRPARGWLNDPNGACEIDGRYHVFFQYNPDEPIHASIAWGHVSSTDLLRWEEEPVALVPRPGLIDAAGCWSGCVVDDAGTPTAVYTANPDHAWNTAVALARSDRTLRRWAQQERPVPGTAAPGGLEVRDPFVFSHQGHRYAVQGAGQPDGLPQLLLYGCDDLEDWAGLGALLTCDDPIAADLASAHIWECPNLVHIDGRWVLLLSLWRWSEGTHQLAGVRYLVGRLIPVGTGLRFAAEAGGLVDAGPAFYAPHVLVTADRALMWGWSWELGRSPDEVDAAGWAGVLTFPRELQLAGDALVVRPAAELDGLRTGALAWSSGQPFAASAFELVTAGLWTLGLAGGSADAVVARGSGPARVLVDGSLVEVFDGPTPRTTRAYPTAERHWIVQADPRSTTLYRLGLG
jgi:beta-fructofuranosidase